MARMAIGGTGVTEVDLAAVAFRRMTKGEKTPCVSRC